jgi:hypothetical protein
MAATRTVILLWLVVALAWLGVPTPALAFAGPSTATPPATSEANPPATDAKPKDAPPASDAATATPEDAAASGDLTTQREQAAAATRADPSPANHHREGQLAEQAGDHAAALAAYEAELAATRDAAARTAVQADLARVRETMRGRVPDEPASTHRKELDKRWGAAKAGTVAKTTVPVATDTGPQKKDRIVRKWYFWVAIAAIAASAAAVTAIAIKASRDDKPDALDRRAKVFGLGTPALRF